MQYETDCPCGRVVVVQAADAGAMVRCGCGRAIEVPSLRLLRRNDPSPPPPSPPPADYAHLRVPGVIVAVSGIAVKLFGVCAMGAGSGSAAPFMIAVVGWLAQVVGVALVCVSKRFPVFMCILFPPFGWLGLVAALFIPERLPLTPPPQR